MRDNTGDGATLAIASEGIRTGLRRHLLWAMGGVLLGVILLTVFVIVADRSEGRRERLESDGGEVAGLVVNFDPLDGFPSGSVDVEFRFADRLRTERVYLDADSPDYEVDDPVTMLVDPDNSERFTIVGESNDSPALVWPMVFALILGGLAFAWGSIAAHQNWRLRRMLSAASWRTLAIVVHDDPPSQGRFGRTYVRVTERRSDRVVRLAQTSRRRIRKSGLITDRRAEVVSDHAGRYVLRPVEANAVFLARNPRRKRQQRVWDELFD